MSAAGQETEAKFCVRDLHRIRLRLEELRAQLLQKRVLEANIRFDLPGAPLRAEGRVLRLRRDTEARLTYKSASTNEEGALRREEVEFVVEDFEKAKRFLEALGYQKLVYYEKYRTTYALQPSEDFAQSRSEKKDRPLEGFVHVMLDELPYGNFVEIEGDTVEVIHMTADRLNLIWDRALATSYYALFERARRTRNLHAQDVSFAQLAEIKIDPADLGVRPADE